MSYHDLLRKTEEALKQGKGLWHNLGTEEERKKDNESEARK